MQSSNKFLQEINTFLEAFKSKKIYVAVSGGLDSMVLLDILRTRNMHPHIIHINYHQRATESDLDQALVEKYCAQHQLMCEVHHFSEAKKGNFQEQARNFRYRIFEEAAKKDEGFIALAHHADDQLETFLMNCMRKSGITGMSAMPRVREKYIRPLLLVRKSELEEYAQQNNISWRTDQSNLDRVYLRNIVRLDFLPIIEKQHPDFISHVTTLIGAFQQELKNLRDKIQPIAKEILEHQSYARSYFENCSEEELRELWQQLHQPTATFHRFAELLELQPGKKIMAHSPLKEIIHGGEMMVFVPEKTTSFHYELEIESVSDLPENYKKDELYLDKNILAGNLVIRPWKNEDSISPIGVQGKQKVSKIIKDAKIPLHKRAEIFVLTDEKEILWVVGLKFSKAIQKHTTTPQYVKIIARKMDN